MSSPKEPLLPPGYSQQPPPQYGQQPGYAQPSYAQQPPPQQTTVVVTRPVVGPGGCPACGGHIRDEFTAVGIILAILFFPIGILCCLAMTERRCANCGR